MTMQAMNFPTQIHLLHHLSTQSYRKSYITDIHLRRFSSLPIPFTPVASATLPRTLSSLNHTRYCIQSCSNVSPKSFAGLVSRKSKKGSALLAFGGMLGEQKVEIAGVPVSKANLEIMSTAVLTIALGVANKVLNKLALIPLRNYPFFLAQFSTFGYVIVYFTILFLRYRAGHVTDEMLRLPKSCFAVIGILEAMGIAAGMSAAAVLPGTAFPILSQTFLVWQLLFSTIFRGKHYSISQILGCAMVITGVIIALTSGEGAPEQLLLNSGYFWPVLMILSFAFQAGASIIKEFVFEDSKDRIKGGSVDLFVVNSFGSGFQALFILFMLPFLASLRGIPFRELPSYFHAGGMCFFNVGSITTECNGAPFLPLLFVAVNMGFNISLLRLLKLSSAVISSLCTAISVPLTIYIFTLPLPYIGKPAVLSSRFFLGVLVLMAGLACYNLLGNCKKFNATD